MIPREILSAVERLLGLASWYCFMRPDSPTLLLAIGQKLPNRDRLPHIKGPDDPRRYEGEYDLFIHCAWRLDGPDGVVTVWTEYGPDCVNGPIPQGISQIYGRKITAVEGLLVSIGPGGLWSTEKQRPHDTW